MGSLVCFSFCLIWYWITVVGEDIVVFFFLCSCYSLNKETIDRQREGERQTDKQRETERDRQTDRQRETNRVRDRQTE